jgi:signal transduction histidine kinase
LLILASDDYTQPWIQLLADGFREVTSKARVQPVVYFESLDNVRFADPAYVGKFRQWLQSKYEHTPVDVVVPIGDHSLGFLANARGEPWPDANVIYMESGWSDIDTRTLLPRSTGVILEDQFPVALRVIKQVLPETKHVALFYGASNVEQDRFRGFADKVREINLGLEPINLSTVAMEELVEHTSQLPAHTVLFLLGPMVDAGGRILSQTRACELAAPALGIPIFSMGLQDVGCGTVGGALRDWRIVGRVLGEQALARLNGPLPEIIDLPIGQFSTLLFDGRALERWGIPESRLPPGSAVQFRRPTLWRDYRPQVLGAIGVGTLEALLIGVLLVERRRRRRAEGEARHHLAAVAHLDRLAAAGQMTASLAHELNQPLGAILRNAEAARMVLSSAAPALDEVRDIVDDIRKDDRRASELIRRLRSLLQKHELEMLPLDINDLVMETVAIMTADARSRDVNVEIDLSNTGATVVGDKVHLQQTLLNLLINGIEAAASMPPDRRRLTVRTVRDRSWVQVAVCDTGPGIPAEVAPRMFEAFYSTKGEGRGMGMGLSIANSIVETHGGRIAAANNPEGGATVHFSLPAHGELS